MGGWRYARIGLGVYVVILVGGALIFRNAGDAALQAVWVVAFVSCFAVYHGLDERDKRRRRRRRDQ